MKRIVLFFSLLLAFNTYSRSLACSGSSPDLMAASPDKAEVQACLDMAVDGDRIHIPSGSATWSSDGLAAPDGIGVELLGAGTPSNDSSEFGPSASCTATQITISASSWFITFTPDYGNATTRISCIEFIGPASGTAGIFKVLGTCTSSGCPPMRIDNLTLTGWAGHTSISYAVSAVGNVFGVFDHNLLDGPAGGSMQYLQLTQIHHASYMGQNVYGDYAWTQPEDYGSEKFVFFENNIFDNASCCENELGFNFTDMGGGRIVVRFNQFINADNYNFAMGFHGTESGGRPRSVRAFEFYGNTFTCYTGGPCDSIAGARGGTGLVWGNTIDVSTNFNTFFTLTTYRIGGTLGDWGPCDGSSPYDENDGMTYDGPRTVASGGGTYTITVSGTPWTTNQWVSNGSPYSIHIAARGQGTEIISNTTNSLTLSASVSGTPWQPADGDSFTILRATKCIDQAGGVGEGILYEPNWPATPMDPADQAVSPAYAWSNAFVDDTESMYCTGLQFCANTARVIRNRDFYEEDLNQAAQTTSSSPFDGTTTIGMGHGIASRKPSSCTAGAGSTKGVGYFANDEGSWNTSGNGFGNGQLYICTATDTWTLSYTPYNYPHPLTADAGTGSPRARVGGRFR